MQFISQDKLEPKDGIEQLTSKNFDELVKKNPKNLVILAYDN